MRRYLRASGRFDNDPEMTASASSEVAELRARLEKSEATRAKLRASLIALKVRRLATRATTPSPPPPLTPPPPPASPHPENPPPLRFIRPDAPHPPPPPAPLTPTSILVLHPSGARECYSFCP